MSPKKELTREDFRECTVWYQCEVMRPSEGDLFPGWDSDAGDACDDLYILCRVTFASGETAEGVAMLGFFPREEPRVRPSRLGFFDEEGRLRRWIPGGSLPLYPQPEHVLEYLAATGKVEADVWPLRIEYADPTPGLLEAEEPLRYHYGYPVWRVGSPGDRPEPSNAE